MYPTEPQTSSVSRSSDQGNAPRSPRSRLTAFTLCAFILCIVFCRPLYGLIRLAFGQELYSHVVLIPLISVYLVWLRKDAFLQGISSKTSPAFAALPLLGGAVVLALHWFCIGNGWRPTGSDALVLPILSFVLFTAGSAFLFFGPQATRRVAFPLVFLLFLVPFPHPVENALEVFFQHTSAEAANLMLNLTGVPVLRDGLFFRLPGITIKVAEECSGIRSSLVLFITSLLAGHMFLRTPWKKALLAFVVIPLAILRNGFRITTLATLCANLDTSWIDSPLHHRGGPIFFALSLVPFFGILVWLRKSELRKQKAAEGQGNP